MAGRMTLTDGKARQAQEDVVFCLETVWSRLELVQLRVNQAMRRSGLVDLLEPALEHLTKARAEIEEAKGYVGREFVGLCIGLFVGGVGVGVGGVGACVASVSFNYGARAGG